MSGPLYRAVWDLGHIAFFAILLMLVQRRHPLDSVTAWLTVTLVVFVVGGAIEYLQTKVGRDGNWGDVLGNLTGAWLGLFWFQRATRLVWLGRIAASVLLIAPLLVVGQLALLQYQVAREFPVISGFENPGDITRWDGDLEISSEFVTQGQGSLKVNLGTQRYAKAALRKFFGDWRHHRQLAFDIYNPDAEPLAMTLRVHDAQHERGRHLHVDRFNTRLMVEPGWNYYRFELKAIENSPRQRKMDMQLIRGVEIYAVRLPRPRVIYLDNLRLE